MGLLDGVRTGLARVEREREGRDPRMFCQLGEARLVACDRHDPGAALGQQDRRRPADPAAGAGHQRDAARQRRPGARGGRHCAAAFRPAWTMSQRLATMPAGSREPQTLRPKATPAAPLVDGRRDLLQQLGAVARQRPAGEDHRQAAGDGISEAGRREGMVVLMTWAPSSAPAREAAAIASGAAGSGNMAHSIGMISQT